VICDLRWVPGVFCTLWCVVTFCFCGNVALGGRMRSRGYLLCASRVCFNKFVVEFCRWSGIYSNSLQQGLVLHTLLFQREAFNKWFLNVSDGEHGLGAKVSTTSLFQQMKCVGRKTILHYSKKYPSIIDERFCLERIESTLCPVSLTGS